VFDRDGTQAGERASETNHWVRDGGNASTYGFTMRWYNAGVSRTMWICCLEYCTRGVHDVGPDETRCY